MKKFKTQDFKIEYKRHSIDKNVYSCYKFIFSWVRNSIFKLDLVGFIF